MIHIVVATPVQSMVAPEYAYSLANLMLYFAQHPIFPEDPRQAINLLRPAEGCVLSGNRERMAEQALKVPDMTHFCWIDSDMGFEPEVLHILARKRQAYVACNYAMKQDEGQEDFTSMRRDQSARVYTGPDSTGLEEAWYTGFGVTLMEKRCLTETTMPRFPIVWNANGNNWSTEDFPFCQMLWDNGIPVYVDHDASKKVWHMGKKGYRWEKTAEALRKRQEEAHGRASDLDVCDSGQP